MRVFPIVVVMLCACGPEPAAPDAGIPDAGSSPVPYAVEVASVTYGEGAGFGQGNMPDVVLGPPAGGGMHRGSLDVVSLGFGGTITLRLGDDVEDGPGVDFVIFENAFRVTGSTDFYREPGQVSVSADGESFTDFPCATTSPFTGCAGLQPVYASTADGGISPFDVDNAGGDRFDLAEIGVARARFIRITDRSTGTATPNQAGFDLDAIAVIHAAAAP